MIEKPEIKIDAHGTAANLKAVAITEPKLVSSVVDKFRAKYAGDVKKYYSKFDAAVVANLN